jgi:uncharacterized protein (DUF305 family)
VKRILAVVLLMAALAACGGDDDAEPNGAANEQEQHNEADVEFAQAMIPHHEQAVDMAELAPTRAESQEVKDLAGDIEAAQAPEIETMTQWLESWDEEVSHGGGHDASGAGMMTEEQMDELEEASGRTFDRLFLEQMTEHHRGAIEMAEDELRDGKFPGALELAEAIRDTQRAEVATMEEVLTRVG